LVEYFRENKQKFKQKCKNENFRFNPKYAIPDGLLVAQHSHVGWPWLEAGQPVQARGRGQPGCCDPVKHIVVSGGFVLKKRLVNLSRLGAEDSQAVVILVNIDSSFVRRFWTKKGLVTLSRLGAE
jgi:hypothetical protein